MKKLEKLLAFIGFIFCCYLIISFIDVNLHNGINVGDIAKYNFFKIFF